jgi:hypothetical protein
MPGHISTQSTQSPAGTMPNCLCGLRVSGNHIDFENTFSDSEVGAATFGAWQSMVYQRSMRTFIKNWATCTVTCSGIACRNTNHRLDFAPPKGTCIHHFCKQIANLNAFFVLNVCLCSADSADYIWIRKPCFDLDQAWGDKLDMDVHHHWDPALWYGGCRHTSSDSAFWG